LSEIGIVTRLSDKIVDTWRKSLDFLIGRRMVINPRTKEKEAFLRARTSARAGDLKESDDAAMTGPDLVAAFEAHGEVLDMLGQTEKAMSLYQAGRNLKQKLRPGAPPDRTFVLRRASRATAEIASYTLVIKNVKQRVLPLIARGNALLTEGQPTAALADYEAALKVKPGLSDVLALKAEALLMLGRFEQAVAIFDAACAAQPRNTDFLSGRAITRLALGRLADADADWHRQFDLLPRERASARACVALRLADYEKALPELERALEKEPHDPYWQLYRMTALRRLGRSVPDNFPELEVWPAPLLRLHVKTPSAEELLAQADNRQRKVEALFQLGVLALRDDPAEARRLFDEVVSKASPSMIEYAAARHELVRLGS
jgi:tetratricopeptide (TPR) repeat protein